MNGRRNVFIACPITKYMVGPDTLDPDFEHFIRAVHARCRFHADDVFLALEREQFGKAIMDGPTCTPLDFAAMRRADLVIALPEDSMGVAVELGWASALRKEVVLLLEERYRYSPLITALHSITPARQILLPANGRKADAIPEVCRLIDELLG